MYSNYKKESNQYGVNAEQRASQGLANSGYAESSQVSLYNTYQTNVTETINETNKLKAEVDFNLNQAYLDADIQKAQNLISIYQQKAELALTEYNLRYTLMRDAISDEQWEKEYNLSLQSLNQSQAQWEAEYALEKQQLEASLSSSGSSGSSSSSGSNPTIDLGEDENALSSTAYEILNTIADNDYSYLDAIAKVKNSYSKGKITQNEYNTLLLELEEYYNSSLITSRGGSNGTSSGGGSR